VLKSGHKSPTCRFKDKTSKDEWAINKAKTKEQSHVNTVNTEQPKVEVSDSSVTKGWSGAHIQFQFYQAKEMKEWILDQQQL
jgi:uncharacterized protein YgiM (DUF1202 family)